MKAISIEFSYEQLKLLQVLVALSADKLPLDRKIEVKELRKMLSDAIGQSTTYP